MKQPPRCPHCPEHPLLWKDTSDTSMASPNQWRWHCTGCWNTWKPTYEQKQRYA